MTQKLCLEVTLVPGSTCSHWAAWNIIKLMTGILSILNSLLVMGLKGTGTFTHPFFLKACMACILSFFFGGLFCSSSGGNCWNIALRKVSLLLSFPSLAWRWYSRFCVWVPIARCWSLTLESFFSKVPEWVVLTLRLVDRYRAKSKEGSDDLHHAIYHQSVFHLNATWGISPRKLV